MKKYIGTKLIEAEKAYRVDGKVVTLAENRVPGGNEVERGYKVRYLQTAVGGVNGEAAAENHCCDEECERSCCDEVTAADEPAAPKLPTVRLFISQPMRGKSDEEIESEREDLIAIAKSVYAGRGEVEVIDSFFKGGLDVPVGAKAPLYYLSKSLELLATADVAIFAKDWREARGCRVEHECADGYGVSRIELPEEG